MQIIHLENKQQMNDHFHILLWAESIVYHTSQKITTIGENLWVN